MIITGNVQSLTGRIPIGELKEGDTVIDLYHCPRKVEAVEEKDGNGYAFEMNPSLAITEGTKVQTVYGVTTTKEGTPYTIRTMGGMEINDELKTEERGKAYNVKVKGTDFIYVDGYAVEVEKC